MFVDSGSHEKKDYGERLSRYEAVVKNATLKVYAVAPHGLNDPHKNQLKAELLAQPAFAWADTFAETSDRLPLFGQHPQYGPRVLFALAYGGNGFTYSMLGAGLLRAKIERRPHPLTALFSFFRLGCQ